MSISLFFILPVALLSIGITIYLMLGFNLKKFEHMVGDIQIGKIDKRMLLTLSREQVHLIRKLFAIGMSTCTLITALIGIVFIKFFALSIASFIVCLVFQLLFFLLIWKYYYHRIYMETKK